MGDRPRTKAPQAEQLKGELKGDLAAYEQFGLFQRSVNKNTAYRYRGALLRYQLFLGANPPGLNATVEYLVSLRKNGFDPATLRVYRAALSGYHQWRGEELKFKVKVPDTAARYVPWEVVQRMLEFAKAKPHDQLILRLMTDAGLRRDEVVHVTVGNVEGGRLRFRGKGGKERSVPMTAELQQLVDRFAANRPKEDPLVNLGEKGVYLMVKRYAALAGSPDLTPHDMRRAFATHLQEGTENIRVVQQLLGHSNVNTTQLYTAVTSKNAEDAIKRLNTVQGKEPPQRQPTPTEPATATAPAPLLEARLQVEAPPSTEKRPGLREEKWSGYGFNIDIASSTIDIASIEITNADPEVAYNLMLFVNDAPVDSLEWSTQQIWTSGKTKSRFKTFKFRDGLNYKDFAKTGLIHVGLELGERVWHLDLPFPEGSQEEREFYAKPVLFDIVVRYRST